MKLTQRLQIVRGPVDMTALINVVLLLLVFFMLSSNSIFQPGIRVDPPRSLYSSGSIANRLSVTITMDSEKHDPNTGEPLPRQPLIFFSDRLVTLTELQDSLRALPRTFQSQPLVLKADKTVPLGTVTDVMNAAMANGLSVVIATRKEGGLNP